jgi:hypothetical protein
MNRLMITVTAEARALAHRRLAEAGRPGAGLRIATPAGNGDDGPVAVDVEFADAPGPGDWVRNTGGVRLFLEPRAATALDGGEIGVENGELVLSLPRWGAAAPAGPSWDGRVLLANTDQELPADGGREVAPRGRRRPLWVVGALTFLSAFIVAPFYPVLWLGLTWAELKDERDDSSMHPWWHALTQLVPIYGYFRFHAHYAMIEALFWTLKGRSPLYPDVYPGRSVIGWMMALGLFNLSLFESDLVLAMGMRTLGAALATAVIVHGQRWLNIYWTARAGRAVRLRVHWAEWLSLALLVAFLALAVIGSLLVTQTAVNPPSTTKVPPVA